MEHQTSHHYSLLTSLPLLRRRVVVERSGAECSSRQIILRKIQNLWIRKIRKRFRHKKLQGTYYKNLLDLKIRKPFRSNDFGGKPFLREIANLDPPRAWTMDAAGTDERRQFQAILSTM